MISCSVTSTSGLLHHHRLRRLAPLLVRHTDHRDIGDWPGAPISTFSTSAGIHVLAAAHDHVLHPVVDEQVPVGIEIARIAADLNQPSGVIAFSVSSGCFQ
jgi:hypothetical protein